VVAEAQLIDNTDGVILDHNLEVGNPADAPQLVPAIERIKRRTGRVPRAVAANAATATPASSTSSTSWACAA
jgi:hypothetical protein